MVDAYASGRSASASARLFGYSAPACLAALRRRGLTPRLGSDARRKWSVDERFFDSIDSEAKAYWLGFLTADAHVGRTVIQIGLASRDRDHLLSFRSFLGSSHPIVDFVSSGHAASRIAIGSIRLANRLRELGLFTNKSATAHPCTEIPDELLRHYWRGVVDGDGWIGCDSRGSWYVGLSGTEAIVAGYRAFLVHCGVRTNAQPSHRANILVLLLKGTGIAKQAALATWGNNTISLARKQSLADQLAATPVRKKRMVQVKP